MATSTLNRKYGWRPDKPDQRDHLFSAVLPPANLPSFVDLRSGFPTCFNQFSLGSCTANAISAVVEFDFIKQKHPIWIPSRLFIYYNERVLEGTVNSDAGAELRDGIKTVARQGVCPETMWPYTISKFATKPPASCYTEALNHKAVAYQSIISTDINNLKSCLAGGYGFVFGFTVYESFEKIGADGIMPMPAMTEAMLGGHAVVGVGYNASNVTVNGCPPNHVIVRNSWSPSWGYNGHFFMPFSYITNQNLACDFWKVTLMS